MTSNERWIPMESNPEIFNAWAQKAGVPPLKATFSDVYGLDPDLLSLVPQPVKAVILLFPEWDKGAVKRKAEDIVVATQGQPHISSSIFWLKQTIDNACGTMALIHALSNANITLIPSSPLSHFIDQCRDKTPLERAHILESTDLFTHIHAEFSEAGDTPAPANLDTDLHFTCFVQQESSVNSVDISKPSLRMIELDGERDGPIDRGESNDLLKDVTTHLKDNYLSQSSNINFSMIALSLL